MTVTLVAEGLSLRFAERQLLKELELVAKPGTLTAVVGPSGTGKTSLLMLLAGLTKPDSGSVSYLGPSGPIEPLIGFVPQTIGIAASLTAAENVALPMQVRGVAGEPLRHRAVEALEALGLGAGVDRLASELSGGQRQRVAIARALALQPDILIADEATAELDVETQTVVIDLLETAAASGTTIILATHDPFVAERCSPVKAIVEGRLEDATPP